MLLPFFYTLRALKIPVGTKEWLTLVEALSADLHRSGLDDFYYLARQILVKTETLYDAYDQAFLMCFKGREGDLDIKKELLDWLNKIVDPAARPEMPDIDPLTLEELRRRFLERLEEQKEEHHGGDKWIGTGGRSPFGHGGSHPSGIRIGGPGGGRMAVKVAEERRFANYRDDRILDVRQFSVALKKLRRLDRVGVEEEFSLDKSVAETCRNAGEIELVFEPSRKNQTELILIMDVGGSMDPYIELTEALFSAAHAARHFKSFKHYYFHNCIYSKLFTDIARREWVPTADLFKKFTRENKVIYVGDACMSPYELFSPGGAIDYWETDTSTGLDWLRRLKNYFTHSVWLNPEAESFWDHPTIAGIGKVFSMHPLTVDGIAQAIDQLKKQGASAMALSHA